MTPRMAEMLTMPGVDSDAISDFYTRHPYPPPVENLDRALDEWRATGRERAEFHLYWPNQTFRRNLDILVAGCGTWQAAKYALCRREARVVAIDVSASSITETAKLKKKYALDNLELHQVPIESVAMLGRDFDLVICTGVLHHLANPDAGLVALRAVMRPGGALYLMVYAPHGRAGIYLLQEYCRRIGIGTSEGDIHDLAATLDALPPQHPFAPTLRRSRDASSPAGLADALLNPRERAYSVPQLLEFLDRGGLRFGRWYWQAPYLPSCGAIAVTAHAARLTGLAACDQHAAMELWRGSMSTHSVIAYRADTTVEIESGISGDGWGDRIPLRLPWTRIVEERLPAGIAGVLVNRSHPYQDLFVPLRSVERRMFECIDGKRSIAQLAADAGAKDAERVHAFFVSLWRHDHVVFGGAHPG